MNILTDLLTNAGFVGLASALAGHLFGSFTKGGELRLAREQLQQKDRELVDAREVKMTEIANAQVQQMYDELRSYCDRLERRQNEMDVEMQQIRSALSASERERMMAEAEVHVFRHRCQFEGACGFPQLRPPAPAPAVTTVNVEVNP